MNFELFQKESTNNNWKSQAKEQAKERGKKEMMARIVGANYTDEACLKHTYTLITVDATGLAASVANVRRLNEYSSSFLELKDYIRKDIGCR